MKQIVAAMVVFGVGLTTSAPALGQETRLSCQVDLMTTDCTKVTGDWPAGELLRAAVSCVECSGGGSDITCSPTELTSAERLAVELPTDQPVGGSFTDGTSCGFGVPLYTYSQLLAGGGTYWLVATIPGHEKVLLLEFDTTGASRTRDGGGMQTRDGLGPFSDSGSTSMADAGDSGDGGTTGDSGTPGTTTDDSGCDCRVTSVGGAWPWVFFLLFVVRRASRRAERTSHHRARRHDHQPRLTR